MTDAWLPFDEQAHREWADAADWVRGGDEGRRFRQEVADAFDDARTWVDPNGYRLSDRIWNAKDADRAAIDNVLRQMIANGTDAIEAAKQVEAYLLPTARNTTVTPRGGRGMYSARRLTRTEMTRAFSASTIRSAALNPFVTGLRWNLSARHPEADSCDPNAGEDAFGMGEGVYPPDQVPRIPAHPHCLCTITPVTMDDEAALGRIIQEMRDQRGTVDPARIAALTADAEAAAERLIRLRVSKAAQAEAERLHAAAMRQAAQTAAKSGGRAEAAWQNAWDFNLKASAESNAAQAALTAAKKAVKGIKDLPAARQAARTAAEDAARQAAQKVANQAAKSISLDALTDDLYNAAAGQVRRYGPDAIEAALRKEVKVPAKTAGRVVFRNAGLPTDVGSQAADRIIASRFDDILREEWDAAVEKALRDAAKAEALDAIAYIKTSKAVKRVEDILPAIVQQAVDDATAALAAAAAKAAAKAAGKAGNTSGYGNVQQRLMANGYDPTWDNSNPDRIRFESAWNDGQQNLDRGIFNSLPAYQQNAIKSYKGNGYRKINQALRGDISMDARVGDHIDSGDLYGYDPNRTFRDIANDIDDGLTRSSSIQDGVLHRGVNKQHVADAYAHLQPGDEYEERGYFSAATTRGSAWSARIQWEIYVPKGMPGMHVDVVGVNPGEKEFLTPEGLRYRIISNTVRGGVRYIVAEALPWTRRVR